MIPPRLPSRHHRLTQAQAAFTLIEVILAIGLATALLLGAGAAVPAVAAVRRAAGAPEGAVHAEGEPLFLGAEVVEVLEAFELAGAAIRTGAGALPGVLRARVRSRRSAL